MGFWHVYMGIYGGGEAAAAAVPVEGWIAQSRSTLFVLNERDRLWIARAKNG